MSRLLLDWLLVQYPTAKRTTLRRMVQAGRVTINGRAARTLKQPLAEQDAVAVIDRVPAEPVQPPPTALDILFEDADLLVVNKPPGLLTSTVRDEKRPTLAALVRQYLAQTDPAARTGIIHRLDRDASGLLVFSKNHDAYLALKSQFFHHTVTRTYTAIVRGKPNPPTGSIRSRLVELPDGSVRTTHHPTNGQLAITHFETVSHAGGVSLLKITLETGRKHQIRAHLSQRGHPVVGDPVYATPPIEQGGLMLCATHLQITHPRSGQPMAFDAPVLPPMAQFSLR